MRFALFQNFETEDTHGNKEVVNKKESARVDPCDPVRRDYRGRAVYVLQTRSAAAGLDRKGAKGSITQTLDMSGKVSSSQKGNFVPIDGTKVLTVNVKVGEYVKKRRCACNDLWK